MPRASFTAIQAIDIKMEAKKQLLKDHLKQHIYNLVIYLSLVEILNIDNS